jgi:hypothetical protein
MLALDTVLVARLSRRRILHILLFLQRPPPLQILWSEECLDAAHFEPRHEAVPVGVEFREHILSRDGWRRAPWGQLQGFEPP